MKLGVAVLATVGSASPVEKVVQLLEGLQTKIEADAEKEQKMYDKFACWCEKTTQRKAGAIEDARREMRRLGQMILSLKGKVAVRTQEIEELTKNLKDNRKAQEKATSVRSKENKSFMGESSETKQAMAALDKAIAVLVKGSKQDSLLQVQASLDALSPQRLESVPLKKLSMLREFAANKHGYAPQSATIQGILGDMYETFASDLETATADEGTKNRDFEDFMATKQEEELEMDASKSKKTKEKAEAEVMLSEATQSYDDTEAQMQADSDFFDDTKETCENNSGLWKERKESRELEIEGIKKALEILTSDEAREKFGKSFGSAAAFVQISEEQESVPIQHAYQALEKQATKSRSLRLAKLAAQVQQAKSGHFDKVIEAIDDVMQTLRDEEADDIKKRDECKDKYQEIQSTVKDLEWKIEKNEAKISKMEKMIAAKTEEREETIDKIEQTLEEIKDMEDTRKEENDEFKEAKKDDENAIELITDARDALAKFYKENAFLQAPDFETSADQAPEFKLSSKGKRKNEASGIVGLMDILIEDLETEIKNGKKAEEESQLEFEKNLKAAKTLIKELKKKKTNLKEQIAEHEEDKTSEGEDKDANNEDLTEENDYKAEIKPDCDWILENFDERDKKREAEMNGLTQAKSYLAGAKPEFLQRVKPHTLRGSQ
jgi:hypothetical protein